VSATLPAPALKLDELGLGVAATDLARMLLRRPQAQRMSRPVEAVLAGRIPGDLRDHAGMCIAWIGQWQA
jgi:hypothetical protein